MANNTLDHLITLTEKGSVEQRCAALLVLAALKLQSARILKTVGTALNHVNPVLKDYALRYFEEVESKSGITLLLPLLEEGDKDTQERAVRLLSSAGQAAVGPLLRRAASASRAWRLNAARVLTAVWGKAAFTALLRMLKSGTDDFNKAVCDLMIPALRELSAKEQEPLYKEVESFAAKLSVDGQRPAVIATIRLFGQLGRPQARRWLFRWIGREHTPSLRAHALVALLRCLREEEVRKDEYARLLPLLEETEFSEVTRLTLELLEAHALPQDSRHLLSHLLESAHGAVQKFALRRMGELSSPATVRTLIAQLGDPDYALRDTAARSLRKIPEARAALIKELLACVDPSKASSIADLLLASEGKWRRETLDSLGKRLQAAIEAEDRIQTTFLRVLKSADTDATYDRLAAQGARLVKAKKFKEAVAFLAPLKEFLAFRPEDKFRLALAYLKLHSRAIAPAAHRQQPVMELLVDLYRDSAYPLFEAMKKEKSLGPEDLFFLGFTLAERPSEERSLGRSLLEHVAARVPRTKLGKSAKNKLKLIAGAGS